MNVILCGWEEMTGFFSVQIQNLGSDMVTYNALINIVVMTLFL